MHIWMRKIILAVMLLVLVSPAAFAEGKEFRLGVITDKPVGRLKEYTPLAKYVADRLKRFGVTRGKVVATKTTDAMMGKIRNREVDVVLESAFPTIEMRESAGIKPELLVWKKGSREYTSAIFVRKESPIKKLSDLKGKTIAFENPESTSAYLLPLADLRRNGLTVLPLNEKGDPSAVRYVFRGEETNQAFFVLRKRADAGAFSSDDWKELPEKVKGELRIIHETKPVLRFIASFHPALPKELSTAISDILIQMDRNPEGQKILKEAANTEKIERLSDKDLQSLKYVQELMRALKQ